MAVSPTIFIIPTGIGCEIGGLQEMDSQLQNC